MLSLLIFFGFIFAVSLITGLSGKYLYRPFFSSWPDWGVIVGFVGLSVSVVAQVVIS